MCHSCATISSVGLVDGVRDQLPAFDLGFIPEARRIGPAEAFAADAGRFR